jgi:hypothetical protein
MIMRGDISGRGCEDGKTGFILNETPRLVINDVDRVVGDPVPLIKACE